MTMREARGVMEAGRRTLLSSLQPHSTISLFRSYSHRTLVPLSWASPLRFSERFMPSPPFASGVTPRRLLARLHSADGDEIRWPSHYRDAQEVQDIAEYVKFVVHPDSK